MWDFYAPPKKRFYTRPWFLAVACTLGVILIAGLIYGLIIKNEYEKKAAQFDMSQLEVMEEASTVFDRNGNVFGKISSENRQRIALSELPYELTQALISAEDSRFYSHSGVDFYGIIRAAVKNWRGHGVRQGASTLTQQLARNTYALREKTYKRKLLEVFLARQIEKHYGDQAKTKVLELYFNRVYFGSGFFGVEAAARGYFGKSAGELDLSECATLVSLLRNPNNLSPWSNRQACVDARNFVLGRMLELKKISQEQYRQALAENLAVKNRKPFHTESYAMEMVRQQVEMLVGRGHAASDGFRIYTTIDPELQKTAEESLREQLSEVENRPDYDHQRFADYDSLFKARLKKAGDVDAILPPLAPPEYLQGAVVALDNATGGIVAFVSGRDFSHSQYNRTAAARPAGTAFKPFVYAAAFEKGIFPGAVFQDAVIDNRQVMIGGTTGILGEWGPERVDNKYEGAISARYALAKSKNAATVRVGMLTGVERVNALAKSAGISTPLRKYASTYLGSSEVTLMDMTLAYTIFPNGGTRPTKPFIIQRIDDKEGDVVFLQKPQKQNVLSETSAYEVHSCLSDVIEWGTGEKATSKFGLKKYPVAGKTGTANNFTDVWFVGYSRAITCGVWAGFDKPTPIYRGAFGSDIALPIWVDVMNASFTNFKATPIPEPRGLRTWKICRKSGLLADKQCPETYSELGTEEQAPKQKCNLHGELAGTAVATAPSGTPTPGTVVRATAAVDPATLAVVKMKGPTVIGDEDPYHSITPTPEATKPDDVKVPEEKVIRRAVPVRPLEKPDDESVIKLDRPASLDF